MMRNFRLDVFSNSHISHVEDFLQINLYDAQKKSRQNNFTSAKKRILVLQFKVFIYLNSDQKESVHHI